jgi:hypothetical protein
MNAELKSAFVGPDGWEVVEVVSLDGRPHTVVTRNGNHAHWFDFEWCKRDERLYYDESGSGPWSPTEGGEAPRANPFDEALEARYVHCSECDDYLPDDSNTPCKHVRWCQECDEWTGATDLSAHALNKCPAGDPSMNAEDAIFHAGAKAFENGRTTIGLAALERFGGPASGAAGCIVRRWPIEGVVRNGIHYTWRKGDRRKDKTTATLLVMEKAPC